MSDPAGLDLGALRAWLDRERPGLIEGRLSADLIAGGKSNLTYLLTAGDRQYVLRRPPLGHVLPTAHDMGREYRVMAALAATDVPVPRTITRCEDTAAIGAPFYVMSRVAGTPYSRADQLEPLGAQRTRRITERMVDTLVDLHAVDFSEIGLADFGRPDGYLHRQVVRWKKQLDASRSRDLPGTDELIARLETTVPDSGSGTIVHGDFRLDNLLVGTGPGSDEDQVTAVLDWEMSTLGDPLTDVAMLLAYHQLAKLAKAAPAGDQAVSDAPLAPGYLHTDEIVQRYAAGSGRDVEALGFHLGLALFKLAVILEGIHFRHVHGQTVGTGFDGIADLIDPLIEAGLSASR